MRTMTATIAALAAVSLLLAGCGRTDQQGEQARTEQPAAASEGWTLADAGFRTPESVLWDEVDDVYYVSNLGDPEPLDRDGDGFISKLGPDGSVLALKWISGDQEGVELNAPKGMARYNDRLLVSDIEVLRAFDVATGEPVMEVPLPGATFANDVWAAKGLVYVTDTGADTTGAVYRISLAGETPEVETLVRDDGLMNPNGILERAGELWMVPYGGAGVFRIMEDGSFETVASAPKGSLDGLVALRDGRLAFSSWEAKAVYVMDEEHAIEPLFTGLESPADIGYDRKRDLLLIPLFMENTVVAKPVG
ncbi:MAG: hypothetical protein MAG453_00773 [Calditrichaeota bacterium]|nr:hypothetical protein [Calditrichota bacterium]